MTDNIRRLAAFAAAAFIIVMSLPSFSAFALNNITYEIPDYAMTMDIPENISVISNNVKKSDELFYNGTFDYIAAMAKMRDDNAVLYGKDKNGKYEIEVTSSQNAYGVGSITKLSQKKLDKLLTKYSADNQLTACSIYRSGNNTFIYSEYRSAASAPSAYVYSYTTIFNNDDISIKLISDSPVSDKGLTDMLRSITDSVGLPQKQPLDLRSLEGRGAFWILVVITLGFIAVIFYRRHEEIVNTKARAALNFTARAANSLKTKVFTKQESAAAGRARKKGEKDKIERVEETDSSEKEFEEEEDLSEIDLDEAIAAFDDRNRR